MAPGRVLAPLTARALQADGGHCASQTWPAEPQVRIVLRDTEDPGPAPTPTRVAATTTLSFSFAETLTGFSRLQMLKSVSGSQTTSAEGESHSRDAQVAGRRCLAPRRRAVCRRGAPTQTMAQCGGEACRIRVQAPAWPRGGAGLGPRREPVSEARRERGPPGLPALGRSAAPPNSQGEAPPCSSPASSPGLRLKVLWMVLRRMQVTVLVTACMWEKSCMAQSGYCGAEPLRGTL